MRLELTILRIGAQGDGIADTADGPVYVPFTLPGERVVAEVAKGRGRLVELCEASPQRRTPVCKHFGECGGCQLQHLRDAGLIAQNKELRDAGLIAQNKELRDAGLIAQNKELRDAGLIAQNKELRDAGLIAQSKELQHEDYGEWKRRRVAEVLAQERIEAAVEPMLSTGSGSRRRATLSAVKDGGRLALGFHRTHSHELIDIEECPVLVPRLAACLPGLRKLLFRLLPADEARISLTAADNGLDVGIEVAGRLARFSPELAAQADKLGLIRISHGAELAFSAAQPRVTLGGLAVEIPPGAFLQASAEAEGAIAALAVEAIGKARTVADLFCGAGTFAFALARRAAVTAVEFDRALLAALESAARRSPGIKPVKTLRRDLMREPLSPLELNAFDAVLFDPPRAGAIAQAKALTASRVPVVVTVSCNPVTFARDARVLVDGGYELQSVVPVDQFVYSAQVELVAVFTKKTALRRVNRGGLHR